MINEAQVYVTDSAYKICMKTGFDLSSFIYSFYNTLTIVCSELFGRYYGGGVLELIPSEFKRLPIPYVAINEKIFQQFYNRAKKAANITEILQENDFDFKLTKRKNSFVVYTGNSNTIEIFLATVGAQLSFLQLVSDKVEKDINNKNNRVANFGNANMEKTKNAGKKVLEAITKLIDTELLYELPEDLQEIAQLKLENPLRSLETLGKMCSEPMTKSSVNRRLQKLCDLAQIEE